MSTLHFLDINQLKTKVYTKKFGRLGIIRYLCKRNKTSLKNKDSDVTTGRDSFVFCYKKNIKTK